MGCETGGRSRGYGDLAGRSSAGSAGATLGTPAPAPTPDPQTWVTLDAETGVFHADDCLRIGSHVQSLWYGEAIKEGKLHDPPDAFTRSFVAAGKPTPGAKVEAPTSTAPTHSGSSPGSSSDSVYVKGHYRKDGS